MDMTDFPLQFSFTILIYVTVLTRSSCILVDKLKATVRGNLVWPAIKRRMFSLEWSLYPQAQHHGTQFVFVLPCAIFTMKGLKDPQDKDPHQFLQLLKKRRMQLGTSLLLVLKWNAFINQEITIKPSQAILRSSQFGGDREHIGWAYNGFKVTFIWGRQRVEKIKESIKNKLCTIFLLSIIKFTRRY